MPPGGPKKLNCRSSRHEVAGGHESVTRMGGSSPARRMGSDSLVNGRQPSSPGCRDHGLGAGAETNGPLAVAVIGGMITSTLLTLVVVPSVYSLVERGIERWHKRHPKAVTE